MDERELFRRIQAGEEAAKEEFYLELRRRHLSAFQSRFGADAEDRLHDLVLRMLLNIEAGKIRNPEHVWTYAFRAALRIGPRDAHSQKSRKVISIDDYLPAFQEDNCCSERRRGVSISEPATQLKDLLAAEHDAVAPRLIEELPETELPPNTKEILRMYHLEEIPTRVIADRLGVTERTVITRKFKGIELIRRRAKVRNFPVPEMLACAA